MTNEVDEWYELLHSSPDIDLFPAVAQVGVEGSICSLESEERGSEMSVYLKIETTTKPDDTKAVATLLRDAADRIEHAARRHPSLLKAGQIGGAQ
jgi:hypothetical protein